MTITLLEDNIEISRVVAPPHSYYFMQFSITSIALTSIFIIFYCMNQYQYLFSLSLVLSLYNFSLFLPLKQYGVKTPSTFHFGLNTVIKANSILFNSLLVIVALSIFKSSITTRGRLSTYTTSSAYEHRNLHYLYLFYAL